MTRNLVFGLKFKQTESMLSKLSIAKKIIKVSSNFNKQTVFSILNHARLLTVINISYQLLPVSFSQKDFWQKQWEMFLFSILYIFSFTVIKSCIILLIFFMFGNPYLKKKIVLMLCTISTLLTFITKYLFAKTFLMLTNFFLTFFFLTVSVLHI